MAASPAGTTFRLRTPPHIKSCHITGSWDKYAKRYQMSPDQNAGWWTLTLKFGSTMPAARYWYYYILDGYFESYDPNKPSILSPTGKQTLNILDHVPSPPSSASSSPRSSSSRFPSPTSSTSSKRSGKYYDSSPPRKRSGDRERVYRAPSPRHQHAELSHLVHPKPRNPLEMHKLTLESYSTYYNHTRPQSMLTTAATTSGDSPNSSRSSSSFGSLGSWCSSCDGNSRGQSPTTPGCTCGSPEFGEYDSCSDIEDDGVEVVYIDPRRSSSYHPPTSDLGRGYCKEDELAMRLGRGLRIS